MNISLPKALEAYVRKKVKSGQYSSASEVCRAGLRVMQSDELEIEEIRRKVQEGRDAIRAGRYITGEEFEKRMRKRIRELARRRKVSAQ